VRDLTTLIALLLFCFGEAIAEANLDDLQRRLDAAKTIGRAVAFAVVAKAEAPTTSAPTSQKSMAVVAAVSEVAKGVGPSASAPGEQRSTPAVPSDGNERVAAKWVPFYQASKSVSALDESQTFTPNQTQGVKVRLSFFALQKRPEGSPFSGDYQSMIISFEINCRERGLTVDSLTAFSGPDATGIAVGTNVMTGSNRRMVQETQIKQPDFLILIKKVCG
jgi:cytochrome c556